MVTKYYQHLLFKIRVLIENKLLQLLKGAHNKTMIIINLILYIHKFYAKNKTY